MAKKRGLASNRGLDALLGSIKKEKLIAGNLSPQGVVVPEASSDSAVPDNKDSADSRVENSYAKNNPMEIHQAKPSQAKTHQAKTHQGSAQTKTHSQTYQNFPSGHLSESAKSSKKSPPATNHPVSVDNELLVNGISLLHMDVTRLQRGKYQPRIDLGEDTLQELATSIRQHGVMQPIVIRPLAKKNGDVTHEIIAGERRWRGAQIVGLTHIPAIERPISDDLAIALALIENIQREDLSIMEQAVALQRFHDEFGMSHAQIADVVGKARTTVSNLLRLNGLHDEVKNALNNKQMDMGHARTLLALSTEQQPIIAKRIVNEQLTVRQTEQLVKDILNPQEITKPSKELDYDRLRLNQQLSEQLGAVVKIKGSSTGKGSIEIYYHSPDELQALIQQLQGLHA